jgi:hypothetical protein
VNSRRQVPVVLESRDHNTTIMLCYPKVNRQADISRSAADG